MIYTTRRQLLKAGAATLAAAAFMRSVPAAHASQGGSARISLNRAPLQTGAFNLLPLGSIRPVGWLRDQMLIQANGLGGHLDETWPDVGPNSGWLGGTGESWERGPYFLDGLVPLAWQLDDARLKSKAQKYIDWTLDHPQPDGMFGPASNNDWWPRMVMLKALTQYYEATNDVRVIPLMQRYFEHQLTALPGRPLKDWGRYRWQDEVVSVLWLYKRNGNPRLLDLARLLKQQGYDWQTQFADFHYTEPCTLAYLGLEKPGDNNDRAMQTHGVNNAQALKASPVWWLLSNDDADRTAFQRQLQMLDHYHGLPNGMFSADEHLAGRNPSQGTELCTVVETMYSLEMALAILGDPAIGDRLEKIAYNALPGTFTDDMWAHQYNQQPNQVEVSLHRKPWTTDGPESNLYGLEPNFGCCTANFHQGWPKLTSSLWMQANDGGLVAAAYAPCELTLAVNDTRVHIAEQTEYPFNSMIRFVVSPDKSWTSSLRFRIPAWAAGATLAINGKSEPAEAGSFARVQRTWKSGDIVELTLPNSPRIVRGYQDSASIESGPIVFSFPIKQDWVKLRERGMTADWQVFPSSQWNYALSSADTANVKLQSSAVTSRPFTEASAPVTVTVNAVKLPQWRAQDGVADPVPQSPVPREQAAIDTEGNSPTPTPIETLRLVPYAAAKLRITSFPVMAPAAS